MGWRLTAVALCACSARLAQPTNANHDSPDASGGQIDGTSANGDGPLGAWGTPTAINGADDPTISQDDCTLNSKATELYFKKAGPAGDIDLFVMTRTTVNDPWGAPAQAAALDSAMDEESPRLSNDDLTIYFGRDGAIYQSTRATTSSPWGTPTAVTQINTGTYNKWLATCVNNNVTYFMVSRAVSRGMTSDQDLIIGVLDGSDAGTDSSLSATGSNEISAFLSPDCLSASFASNRSGQTQLYTASRQDPTQDFGPAAGPDMDYGPATDNEDLWISGDSRTSVFASIRGGDTNKALYISTR